MRKYFGGQLQPKIERGIKASINLKQVGNTLGLTIKHCKNKVVIAKSKTDLISREVLSVITDIKCADQSNCVPIKR